MATWGGIRAWTNESYANVSDMERVFGNLEFLMERTKSVTVSAPDKARAVELKSVAINDIIYKEDFDWFYDQMQTFCAAYEAAGGGFQYPSADKTTLNGALMTLISTVIPRTETCYEWYMDFDLIEKSNDKKKMVWEFTIDYNEARAYRSENDGMLRPTQWSDIIVKVYV